MSSKSYDVWGRRSSKGRLFSGKNYCKNNFRARLSVPRKDWETGTTDQGPGATDQEARGKGKGAATEEPETTQPGASDRRPGTKPQGPDPRATAQGLGIGGEISGTRGQGPRPRIQGSGRGHSSGIRRSGPRDQHVRTTAQPTGTGYQGK